MKRFLYAVAMLAALSGLTGCIGGGQVFGGPGELIDAGWEPLDQYETVGVAGYWPVPVSGDPDPARRVVEVGLTVAQSEGDFDDAGFTGQADLMAGEAFMGLAYHYNMYPDSWFKPYWAWGLGVQGVQGEWSGQNFDGSVVLQDETDDDVGLGVYVRGGVDLRLGPALIGLGVRYRTTTSYELQSGLSDVEFGGKLRGFDYLLTLTLWPRPVTQ